MRPRVVRVRGRSMLPTYRDGDLLLAIEGARPRAGSVVVLRLPPDRDGMPRPLAVKRLTGRDPDDHRRWWFVSDNSREGVTSFEAGPVAEEAIEAVVLSRVPRWLRRHRPTP